MTADTPSEQAQYYVRSRGRITGPFSIERLTALKNRGRIGKTQQISSDRKNWIPASQVVGLFDSATQSKSDDILPPPRNTYGQEPLGDLGEFTFEPAGEDFGEPFAGEATTVNEPAPSSNWYYYRDNEQQGPMTLEVMQTLVQTGQINKATQVWHEGASEWLPASHYASLNPQLISGRDTDRGSRRAFLIGSGLALAACGGAAAFLPRIVISLGSHAVPLAGLSEALGRVYVGVVTQSAVGVTSETGSPTGTAFRINDRGYLLTNRSVIRPFVSPDLLGKVKQLNEADVTATGRIWVFFGQRRTEATLVHASEDHPFAILKCGADSDHYFTLSSENNYERHAEVVSHGYPGAPETPLSQANAVANLINEPEAKNIESSIADDSLEYLTDRGEIRRVSQESRDGDDEETDEQWVIHSDCAYSPCSRGGPLLDQQGVVIGLNDDVPTNAGKQRTSIAVFQLRDEIDNVARDEGFEVTWVS